MQLFMDILEDGGRTAIEIADSYDMGSELHLRDGIPSGADGSTFRCFHTDGLALVDAQAVFPQGNTIGLCLEHPIAAMVFCMEGGCGIVPAGEMDIERSDTLSEGHDLRIVREKALELRFAPGRFTDAFIVLLSGEFCQRIMPQEHGRHGDLFRALERGEAFSLFPDPPQPGSDMRRIIANVRNCSRQGSFHRLCLEIKMAELLMLQLEQHQLLGDIRKLDGTPHPADLEKIAQAKKILDGSYACPPTIKTLAGMVGMNETKLKADFKKMHQSTIHEYTVALRMRKAYELITRQNLLLKEVAEEVGYQKASNFTKAFADFFGVLPKQAGKNMPQKQ